jgi:hypothetical protein
VTKVLAEKLPIVFVDETVFTKNTVRTVDYSNEYQNLSIANAEMYRPYVMACAAVSADAGVDLVEVFQTSLNSQSFVAFVEKVAKLRGHQPFALFVDRAGFHHSVQTREMLK